MNIPLEQVVTLLARIADWHKIDEKHGHRVAEMAVKIGKRLNGGERLKPEQIELLGQAACLHDLGRVGVDDLILAKRGALTASQRAAVQAHTLIGYDFVHDILPAGISMTILSHHEHWDGSGYPKGLKGLDIPLFARIVSIADTWDALTSDRPYRKAHTRAAALEIMNQEAAYYDPQLYTIFLEILRESE